MGKGRSTAELELPQHVLEYLAGQKTLTLASASAAGVPHAATFMYANDGLALYFWARPTSITARHVEQNPVVALAIDEYAEDPRQTRGVQATGECRPVLGGDEIVRAVELLGDKFRSISSGASTTNIAFFRVAPTQLSFIDNSAGGERTQEEFGLSFHSEVAFNALDELPEQRVGTLSATLQRIEVDAGDVIVRQGGPADKFFIVLEGELEVVREEDAGEQRLATLRPGQFFGEMAVLRDSPRAATVRAVAPGALMVMERDSFKGLVAQSLGTAADFDRVLRDRLDRLGAGEGA